MEFMRHNRHTSEVNIVSKTLEELKQEIAESETETNQAPLEEVEIKEEVNEEVETETENLGEDEQEEDETESLDWLEQEEEQTSSDSVPLSKHIKTRQKLKDKIQHANDENEQLRLENERLRSGQVELKPKPKRDDFFEHDDPDEAYLEALSDWKIEQKQQTANQQKIAENNQRMIESQQRKIESDVSEHYQRAESFIKKHNISHDVYLKAETNFKDAVKAVNEEAGDGIVNSLISTIGEGSEKLMMYVGGNQQRREQLQTSLSNDPAGLKTMMLLGKWSAEIESPKKRVSQAPRPTSTAKGDVAITQTESRLKKRYQKAMKDGDAQAVYNSKRDAKKAGYNTNSW